MPKNNTLFWPSVAALVLAAFFVTACDGDPKNIGVVARINGKPVFLDRLESRYDFTYQETTITQSASVDSLRQEYGQMLTELIVQELILQELEKQEVLVTQEEVAQAEATIRQDYPDETFEEVLVEEYIDIDLWREELQMRLSLEKFFQEILRPGVQLDYQEVQQYYKENIASFTLSPQIDFKLLQSASQKTLEKALSTYQKAGKTAALAKQFPSVTVHTIQMQENRLNTQWKHTLQTLQPGQASAVLTDSSGFQALILTTRHTPETLTPAQAYPLVEQHLLEKKLQQAFGRWLATAVAKASIEITPHLPIEKAETHSATGIE